MPAGAGFSWRRTPVRARPALPPPAADRTRLAPLPALQVPEEWGGKTPMVPLSAKKGTGVDALLETVRPPARLRARAAASFCRGRRSVRLPSRRPTWRAHVGSASIAEHWCPPCAVQVLLVAELEELQANPARTARGTVLEASLDRKAGAVCSLLVQAGTLRVGDAVQAGSAYGKVRRRAGGAGKRAPALPPPPGVAGACSLRRPPAPAWSRAAHPPRAPRPAPSPPSLPRPVVAPRRCGRCATCRGTWTRRGPAWRCRCWASTTCPRRATSSRCSTRRPTRAWRVRARAAPHARPRARSARGLRLRAGPGARGRRAPWRHGPRADPLLPPAPASPPPPAPQPRRSRRRGAWSGWRR